MIGLRSSSVYGIIVDGFENLEMELWERKDRAMPQIVVLAGIQDTVVEPARHPLGMAIAKREIGPGCAMVIGCIGKVLERVGLSS